MLLCAVGHHCSLIPYNFQFDYLSWRNDWLEGGCGGFPEAVIGPCRRRVDHIHSTAAAEQHLSCSTKILKIPPPWAAGHNVEGALYNTEVAAV